MAFRIHFTLTHFLLNTVFKHLGNGFMFGARCRLQTRAHSKSILSTFDLQSSSFSSNKSKSEISYEDGGRHNTWDLFELSGSPHDIQQSDGVNWSELLFISDLGEARYDFGSVNILDSHLHMKSELSPLILLIRSFNLGWPFREDDGCKSSSQTHNTLCLCFSLSLFFLFFFPVQCSFNVAIKMESLGGWDLWGGGINESYGIFASISKACENHSSGLTQTPQRSHPQHAMWCLYAKLWARRTDPEKETWKRLLAPLSAPWDTFRCVWTFTLHYFHFSSLKL